MSRVYAVSFQPSALRPWNSIHRRKPTSNCCASSGRRRKTCDKRSRGPNNGGLIPQKWPCWRENMMNLGWFWGHFQRNIWRDFRVKNVKMLSRGFSPKILNHWWQDHHPQRNLAKIPRLWRVARCMAIRWEVTKGGWRSYSTTVDGRIIQTLIHRATPLTPNINVIFLFGSFLRMDEINQTPRAGTELRNHNIEI